MGGGAKMLRETAGLYRPARRRLIGVALLMVACTSSSRPDAQTATAPAEPPAFSAMRAGGPLAPWTPVTIAFGKRRTHYELVDDNGNVVLHAVADNAASALGNAKPFDLFRMPVLAWRWKIAGLIETADPRKASREDAPARIVLEFDGDVKRLPLLERGIYGIAEHVAGRALPYATLMYIWTNDGSVGTVIANPRTRRIQMIVASSGAAGVGAWQALRRNVRDDFRRAFGEEPGALTAVGVLTDSDNTDGHAEAWYGDLRFEPAMH
jgi:hypothetical protein